MKWVIAVLFCSMTAFGDDAELLKSLEKSFSSIKTVKTRFTQEKRLKVFERTIILKGRLVLENPNRMAWRIDSPIKYALVLDGDHALQWDEETDKVQKMKTTGDPVFEQVLGQIEKWFSGRFILLVNDYDLTVESEKPLRMVFIPKEGSLTRKAIKRVVVSVRDDHKYVEQIAIEDVSGDETTIRFHDTVLNAAVDPAEWKVDSDG